MPTGVYPRTEKHKAVCSMAGKISAEKRRQFKDPKHWVTKICPTCGKEFSKRKFEETTYCCVKCSSDSLVRREKISRANIGIPRHTKPHSAEAKEKMRLKKIGKRLSVGTEWAKTGRIWKGKDREYVELHEWVRSEWGTPDTCELCGSSNKRTEWASVNHVYTKNREDWKRLCTKCHREMDNRKRKRDLI